MGMHDGYMHDGFAGNDGFVGNEGFGGGDCCNSCNTCCVNEAPCLGLAYNPAGYLKCGHNCCESFLDTLRFRVDFLWWRADEDGLDLGSEQLTSEFFFPDDGLEEFLRDDRTKKPDGKYDAGFRLGLASICENCWDVALNWTHFYTKSHARGFSNFDNFPESSILFENCWEAREGAVPDFAKARWKLDLDLLDLEFGHKYYVDHCFIMRPHAGLRGARVDQKYRVFSFANRASDDVLGPQQYDARVNAKNDFLGIGPRVGLDLEFKLACGVSVFGQAAGSLLFGRFDRNSHEDFDDFFNDFNATFRFKSSAHRTSRAVTDLAIGLKWDHCFEWCCRCHPLSIAVTWEHHGFFRFNEFKFRKNSVDPTGSLFEPSDCCSCGGDLFTQGLTLSFEVGF